MVYILLRTTTEMKTTEMAKKATYIGAGAGLVLFAVVGLLPGSFLGGVIGLNIAGSLFGMPVGSAILPRLIVGISMLLGVLVSALIFITGASIIGWLIGYVVDSLKVGKTAPVEVKNK
jgi:Mg/Co/Ni transporter MgtE